MNNEWPLLIHPSCTHHYRYKYCIKRFVSRSSIYVKTFPASFSSTAAATVWRFDESTCVSFWIFFFHHLIKNGTVKLHHDTIGTTNDFWKRAVQSASVYEFDGTQKIVFVRFTKNRTSHVTENISQKSDVIFILLI